MTVENITKVIYDAIDDIFEYDDLVRDFLNEEELILLYTIIVKSLAPNL